MSKELEAWKRVRESAENADGDAAVYEIGDCDIVEKELKALEIIKEKEVNVYDFKEYESKYEYNKHTKEEFQELTQEEYDLLKEVLL